MCFLEEEQGNDLAAIQNSNYLIIRRDQSLPPPFCYLKFLFWHAIYLCYWTSCNKEWELHEGKLKRLQGWMQLTWWTEYRQRQANHAVIKAITNSHRLHCPIKKKVCKDIDYFWDLSLSSVPFTVKIFCLGLNIHWTV